MGVKLHFVSNNVKAMIRLKMKNYNTILTEKEQKYQQYQNIKISAGKIYKYEFLTGEEILHSDQSRIIEKAKFTYSPFRIAFEKQIKTIDDQGIKQVEDLKTLKLEEKKKLETTE